MNDESIRIIAVGSRRRPKILACHMALQQLGESACTIRLEARSVDSSVASTPVSTEAMMLGARYRARRVLALIQDQGARPRFAIGLEGGIKQEPLPDRSVNFLESWAFVTDGRRGYFGSSGAIELPARLSDRVLCKGEELGDASDAEFHKQDIAGAEGTFGVLSANAVTREAAFVRSLLHAFAPFYNDGVYRPSDTQGVP